jgi:tRNA pseudouridine38-40 synthase
LRYFIEIAYKGTAYHGWQRQENAISIQQTIEEALSKILNQPIEITGSGRTDTGVHALQQFIHFDTEKELEEYAYKHKLNAILPFDISVQSIRKVKPDAHARFDAVSRSYEYRIYYEKNPFLKNLGYFFNQPLDINLMNQAANLLYEYEDFQCFSKVKTEVNNFICHISNAQWQEGTEGVVFHITANRFLRGMVRAITGTLLEIGTGKTTIDDFRKIIASKDRSQAGRSVPADGLFLNHISYPKEIFIAQ